MRKVFIPVLLTLISSAALSPVSTTSAAIYDRDTTWWSVEELLDFYPEVEAEKEAECGHDQDCRMEFDFSMIERGGKYNALNNLLESQFWITSINPETETIKVLFFDDDMMLRRMGIEEKLELENLYIGWTEPWLGHGYYHGFDRPFDNTMPGVHLIYNSEIEDVGSIIPWQENEFPMIDPDISGNTTGVLYVTIYAKNNLFNAQGSVNYANCLNSPDYQAGMECKMYVSGDQWVSYFPPRESIAIEEMPIVDTSEPNDIKPTIPEPDDTESELTLEPSITENEPIIELTDTGNETWETDGKVSSYPNTQTTSDGDLKNTTKVHAPDTGVTPSEGTNAIEFPWWMAVIIAINAIVLVWLFLPIRIKTPRGSAKNKAGNRQHGKSFIPIISQKDRFFVKSAKKPLTKNSNCDKMVSV